eukprot:GAHX01000928.1.p1 GENE.GAHX01000928.1~~GAHX01000928.1.p1  ORF type:complete len:137 (+),score=24.03 GAHX01000928.1:42-452(+)
MGRSNAKSNKHKKKAKNSAQKIVRELVTKGTSQEYAKVLKTLGYGRLLVYCLDGKTRICQIRGKLKSRVWIREEDIILVSLRDFEDDRCDAMAKYTSDLVKELVAHNHIPKSFLEYEQEDTDEEQELSEEVDIEGL